MKYTVAGSGIIVGVAILTWSASFGFYKVSMGAQQEQYESILAQKSEQLIRYEAKSKAGMILKQNKNAGEVIQETDVERVSLPDYFAPDNLIQSTKDVVGKVIKIKSSKGTAITDQMVYAAEKLDATRRKVEVEYIRLPLRAAPQDVVDVRILFPNGEDYVVVSKKKLTDVDVKHQVAFFELNEDEHQLLSSAMVDANFNEAELYAVQYIEPQMQEEAAVTYTPTQAVLSVIASTPNIVNKARWELSAQVRAGIDSRLKAIPKEDLGRIGSAPPAGSAAAERKLNPAAAALMQKNTAPNPTSGTPNTVPAAPPAQGAAAAGSSEPSGNTGLLGGG